MPKRYASCHKHISEVNGKCSDLDEVLTNYCLQMEVEVMSLIDSLKDRFASEREKARKRRVAEKQAIADTEELAEEVRLETHKILDEVILDVRGSAHRKLDDEFEKTKKKIRNRLKMWDE